MYVTVCSHVLMHVCSEMIFTGASCLGRLLKTNNSLQELIMSCNEIGDDGMAEIAEGLKYNTALTELSVRKCGFSVKGIVNWFLHYVLV